MNWLLGLRSPEFGLAPQTLNLSAARRMRSTQSTGSEIDRELSTTVAQRVS